jgi:hypothetical protein
MGLALPETFLAPHLRRFVLSNVAIPIGSPLITTATGLVTFNLMHVHPSSYFHPGDLLERLSIMPHLEILRIGFHSPVPSYVVERELSNMAGTMIHAALPNLTWFTFVGTSAYLEALLRRMAAPSLEKIEINIFNQLTYSVPSLIQCMSTIENLRFPRASLDFYTNAVSLAMNHQTRASRPHFLLDVICGPPHWQVSSMVQVLNTSVSVSFVEFLTIRCPRPTMSSDGHVVDRTQWRELLRPFGNVKTLEVVANLVEDISRTLQPDGGESPMELLPELKELSYSGGAGIGEAFKAFTDARQNVGRPVTVVESF